MGISSVLVWVGLDAGLMAGGFLGDLALVPLVGVLIYRQNGLIKGYLVLGVGVAEYLAAALSGARPVGDIALGAAGGGFGGGGGQGVREGFVVLGLFGMAARTFSLHIARFTAFYVIREGLPAAPSVVVGINRCDG